MAMSDDAVKSEKPISCNHIVKKTIAFHGVDPLSVQAKTWSPSTTQAFHTQVL